MHAAASSESASRPAADPPPGPPWSERLCDGVVLSFALWTVCCWVIVAIGGGLRWLVPFWVASPLLALAAFRFLGPPSPSELAAAPAPNAPDRGRGDLLVPTSGAVAALLALAAFLWHRSTILLWWSTVVLLGLGVAWSLRGDAGALRVAEPGPTNRRRQAALWLIALLCVVLTLFAHRPDADDAFYIGLAVTAVDRPDWPLMSSDPLHGSDAFPFLFPAYRFHSYELWNAALSYLSGIPAIHCFHWLSAALAALLVPLAYARLARWLTPRSWLGTVAGVLLVLVAAGEVHRWYGNFAFVRMWQGKAILVSVLLPLLLAYALEFSLRPGRRTWALLVTAQIAAIGYTSSAIWAAPAVVVMTFASTLDPERRRLRLAAAVALSCLVPLAVGLYLRVELRGSNIWLAEVVSAGEPGEALETALTEVLGRSRLLLFTLLSVMAAWTVCREPLLRRFASVVPFLVATLLLNPYLDRWIPLNLVGGGYWRALWALPVPLLLTLVLLSPLRLASLRGRPVLRTAVALGSFALFAWTVPSFSSLAEENGVRVGRPGLKVPAADYRLAARLNQGVEPGDVVLAPAGVNVWIPTLHRHATPLAVRSYLRAPPAAREARDRLIRMSEGPAPSEEDRQTFLQGLADLEVRVVCMRSSPSLESMRGGLVAAGFERTWSDADAEIWSR